jgi:hypothetical protein
MATLTEVRDAAVALRRCGLEADLRPPSQTLSQAELAELASLLRDLSAYLPVIYRATLRAFAYARLKLRCKDQ